MSVIESTLATNEVVTSVDAKRRGQKGRIYYFPFLRSFPRISRPISASHNKNKIRIKMKTLGSRKGSLFRIHRKKEGPSRNHGRP